MLWCSAALAYPDPALPQAILPPDAAILGETLEGSVLEVYLELPDAHAVDAFWLERLSGSLVARRSLADERVHGVRPWVVDPFDPSRGWVSLESLLPPVVPVTPRAWEAAASPDDPPPITEDGPVAPGGLHGKVIYVSAGHGFTWDSDYESWGTQRGNTNGIVEDLVSIETANHFLVRYLRQAGATVFTVREQGLGGPMVIVDIEWGGGATTDGTGMVTETCSGWTDSTARVRRPRGELEPGAGRSRRGAPPGGARPISG